MADDEDRFMDSTPAGTKQGDRMILEAPRANIDLDLNAYPPQGEKQKRGSHSTHAKALRRGFFG